MILGSHRSKHKNHVCPMFTSHFTIPQQFLLWFASATIHQHTLKQYTHLFLLTMTYFISPSSKLYRFLYALQ
jgi:hypothetical protein